MLIVSSSNKGLLTHAYLPKHAQSAHPDSIWHRDCSSKILRGELPLEEQAEGKKLVEVSYRR